jgi:hypothetical protein
VLGFNIKEAVLGEIKKEFPNGHATLVALEAKLGALEGYASKLFASETVVLKLLTALNALTGGAGVFNSAEIANIAKILTGIPADIQVLEADLAAIEKVI